MVRWILTFISIIFALLFWYMTFTVPMVQATSPAILALVCSGAAYLFWPRRKTRSKSESSV